MLQNVLNILKNKYKKNNVTSKKKLSESSGKYNNISFKEGFCLTTLPICIFFQGNKSFTFLLDTGSDENVIDKNILKDITHEMLEDKGNIMGLEGISTSVETCNIDLEYNKNTFSSSFLIKDMQKPFSEIKKQTGVTLHGILGSKFFRLFQFVLDFDELIAYSKLTLQKNQ